VLNEYLQQKKGKKYTAGEGFDKPDIYVERDMDIYLHICVDIYTYIYIYIYIYIYPRVVL